MLKPKVKASEFTKYGFKRCKGYPKELKWYYLCIAADSKVLFVSDVCFLLVIGIKMIREYINFQIANIEIIEIHMMLYMI